MVTFPRFLYNAFGTYDLLGSVTVFRYKYRTLVFKWSDVDCIVFLYDTYNSFIRLVGDDLGTTA